MARSLFGLIYNARHCITRRAPRRVAADSRARYRADQISPRAPRDARTKSTKAVPPYSSSRIRGRNREGYRETTRRSSAEHARGYDSLRAPSAMSICGPEACIKENTQKDDHRRWSRFLAAIERP